MEFEGGTDLKSGRNLIDGKGAPIVDGIFRRPGFPGIVVDLNKMGEFGWFVGAEKEVLDLSTNLLNFVTSTARQNMPIKIFSETNFGKRFGQNDRYSLSASTVRGVPDAQALLVALLIELRLKEKNDPDRKVAIIKDPKDGHAIVLYHGKSGDTYRFNPAGGDTAFVKLAEGAT